MLRRPLTAENDKERDGSWNSRGGRETMPRGKPRVWARFDGINGTLLI